MRSPREQTNDPAGVMHPEASAGDRSPGAGRSRRRSWIAPLTTACMCLLLLAGAATSTAGRDRKPPRILSAAMADTDRDASADAMRLTYSEAIRHVRDANGAYPFTVAGYRIRSVGPASRRSVVIRLVEHGIADTAATPAIRYRRTTAQPVKDGAGNQAISQVFRATRPHGVVPKAEPDPGPEPDPTPTAKDSDGDGFHDGLDCAPNDRQIHPGASDAPDLAFVDANCDGIDGDERKAIFVSPLGKDTNAGTKAAPKRQIQAGLAAAAAARKDVYAAAGEYARVEAVKGVGVYGGYRPDTWARGLALTTTIAGAPEGVYAEGVTDVVLQLLTVRGQRSAAPGSSVYGIRAVAGSKLAIQRVTVLAADAANGAAGADGRPGIAGEPGANGSRGQCDAPFGGFNAPKGKTPGGRGAFGRDGGTGGGGGREDEDGDDGGPGTIGTPGGAGGDWGSRGKPGRDGSPGAPGADGASGLGGTSSTALAGRAWKGDDGAAGKFALPGTGGGGGGGGGGQSGLFVHDGIGNDGGGGGGAGGPGQSGFGGGFGGGSFGVYLHDSALAAVDSTIRAGNGGAGGAGGKGALGGAGGAGGRGGTTCTSEVGAGGNGGPGGKGGNGGSGGGGAGGPSVGVFQAGRSSASLKGTAVTAGNPGLGGPAGPFATRPADSKGATGIARSIHPVT